MHLMQLQLGRQQALQAQASCPFLCLLQQPPDRCSPSIWSRVDQHLRFPQTHLSLGSTSLFPLNTQGLTPAGSVRGVTGRSLEVLTVDFKRFLSQEFSLQMQWKSCHRAEMDRSPLPSCFGAELGVGQVWEGSYRS